MDNKSTTKKNTKTKTASAKTKTAPKVTAKTASKTTRAKSAPKTAPKAPKTAPKEAKTEEKSKETSTQTAIRVVLLIIGIIGLITNVAKLIALIPVSIFGMMGLAAGDIPDKPLLIVAASLGIAMVFAFIVLGFIIFGRCVGYFIKPSSLKRGWIAGVIVNFVLGVGLLIAACVTGGVWASRNRDDINRVIDDFFHSLDIRVDEECNKNDAKCDSSVEIKDGKIHIRNVKG